MRRLILLATTALLLIAVPAYASVLENRTENFDVDPGWTAVGSGSVGSSFGYQSSSTNAGGAAGEGGGLFTRQTSPYFYADTILTGSFNLDVAFSASGRLDVTQFQHPDTGAPLILGHFEQAGLSQIGIVFTDNSTGAGGQLFWGPRLHTANGNAIFPNNGVVAIGTNIDRFWSYSWDPDGGIHGSGLLTTTLTGPGGGTIVANVNAAQRANGASFDAFGISNPGASDNASSNRNMSLYIDEVTYSTAKVIPEPSTFILALLATLGLSFKRRRRQRA